MNIYQKLIEVRKVVPYIQKADIGTQYAYTGSSRVLAAVKEKMDELGLLLVPSVTGHRLSESPIEFKDSNGNVTKRTTTYFTELEMLMTWINADKPDETIVSCWYGQGVDIAGEKGVGKALTYAEKYFILKFFNIATDKDDPDAFQAKHEAKEPTPQPVEKPSEVPATPPPSKGAENLGHHADLLQKSKEVFQQIKGSLEGFDVYNDTKLKNRNNQEAILDGLIKLLLKQEKGNANAAPVG